MSRGRRAAGEKRGKMSSEMVRGLVIRRLDAGTLGVGGVVRALERSPGSVDPDIRRRVAEIVAAVREKGDAALLELTERFDRVSLSAAELAVDAGEYRAAERQVGVAA